MKHIKELMDIHYQACDSIIVACMDQGLDDPYMLACYEMWTYLRCHPLAWKSDYINTLEDSKRAVYQDYDCAACAACKDQCAKCPLRRIWNGGRCVDLGTPYVRWRESLSKRLLIRESLAREIADACVGDDPYVTACRDMWRCLAETCGDKAKGDYPHVDDSIYGIHACAACTECRQICSRYFLYGTWGSDVVDYPCLELESPYIQWIVAGGGKR